VVSLLEVSSIAREDSPIGFLEFVDDYLFELSSWKELTPVFTTVTPRTK
jgi:hypothetical protein